MEANEGRASRGRQGERENEICPPIQLFLAATLLLDYLGWRRCSIYRTAFARAPRRLTQVSLSKRVCLLIDGGKGTSCAIMADSLLPLPPLAPGMADQAN